MKRNYSILLVPGFIQVGSQVGSEAGAVRLGSRLTFCFLSRQRVASLNLSRPTASAERLPRWSTPSRSSALEML